MASQSTCKSCGMLPVNSMFAASNKPSITINPTAADPLDSGMKLYLKNSSVRLTNDFQMLKNQKINKPTHFEKNIPVICHP